MKRWAWFCVSLAAIWALARVPHPARDVGKLEPVSLVSVAWMDGMYHIRTDTGAEGTGPNLETATQNLAQRASGTVFLETADYLLLSPGVPITKAFYAILRPGCGVCLADAGIDLVAAAEFLEAHPPEYTLNDLRAGEYHLNWLRMEEQRWESSN